MTKTEKRMVFIRRFSALIQLAYFAGIDFIITSYYRTAEEQNKLYKEGKSKLDGYDKKSKHQEWLAIDLVIIKNDKAIWDRNEEYEKLGSFWKLLGGVWGGDWKSLNDIYHFQW